LKGQQKRDNDKQLACEQHGITLIEVPYWRDKQTRSLAATIYKARPELIDKSFLCLSEE